MSVQEYRNDLIKGAMAQKGFTKDALKRKTGLSTDTLRRIRAGETNITLSNLMIVAGALDLPMQELFKPKNDTDAAAA
jgi:transcriptional regulator with XRE-family HTH domain